MYKVKYELAYTIYLYRSAIKYERDVIVAPGDIELKDIYLGQGRVFAIEEVPERVIDNGEPLIYNGRKYPIDKENVGYDANQRHYVIPLERASFDLVSDFLPPCGKRTKVANAVYTPVFSYYPQFPSPYVVEMKTRHLLPRHLLDEFEVELDSTYGTSVYLNPGSRVEKTKQVIEELEYVEYKGYPFSHPFRSLFWKGFYDDWKTESSIQEIKEQFISEYGWVLND